LKSIISGNQFEFDGFLLLLTLVNHFKNKKKHFLIKFSLCWNTGNTAPQKCMPPILLGQIPIQSTHIFKRGPELQTSLLNIHSWLYRHTCTEKTRRQKNKRGSQFIRTNNVLNWCKTGELANQLDVKIFHPMELNSRKLLLKWIQQ